MENDFVEIDRENLKITVHLRGGKDLVIGKYDIEISYFSGGPGGQNVNKNMNGVRLIYRIPTGHLRGGQKTRELVTRSINQRKKEQNIAQAFEQLADKLRRYFYVQPQRKKTRTPKSAKEKRIHGKKMKGRIKELRGNVMASEI
jgi:ribosome-associated protein